MTYIPNDVWQQIVQMKEEMELYERLEAEHKGLFSEVLDEIPLCGYDGRVKYVIGPKAKPKKKAPKRKRKAPARRRRY